MTATTPIYSLRYPEYSDAVTDGAQAIEDLATDIETMMSRYNGMVKIPLTAVASCTANSDGNIVPTNGVTSFTFSIGASTYRSHRFIWREFAKITSRSFSSIIFNPAVLAPNYYSGVIYQMTPASSVQGVSNNNASSGALGLAATSTGMTVIEVHNLAQTDRTYYNGFSNALIGTELSVSFFQGFLDNTTAASQIRISPGSSLTTPGVLYGYGFN